MTDVDLAKKNFCAQFTHVGCGGGPVAWINQKLCCDRCSYQQECSGDETLGAALSNPAWGRRDIVPIHYEQPSMF